MKLRVPSPWAAVDGGCNAQLVAAGFHGVVWARYNGSLFAITPSSVENVPLPPLPAEDRERAFVALPDGSLVFFGPDGRIVRLVMDGLNAARAEVVSDVDVG